ncbi:MAG: hypothetical protein KAI84_10770 [Gammaproteobacteria bacterium]|jgi:hypothetical protein|nr:hypothetical protein [Gammaproteobacteria bacterium]
MNIITGSIPMITAEIHGKSHANLAHIHLNSARIFVQSAFSIENKNKPLKNAPQETIDSYMSYVSSSIICSISSLEAKINQFLVDNKAKLDEIKIEKNPAIFKHYSSVFDTEAPFLNQLRSLTNALMKYNVIFYLLNGKFLPDNKLFKGICFAIRVRNALIHFSPEWDNELKLNKELEDRYFSHFSSDFDLSPVYYKDELFIPHRCLSASHAEWAYKNSDAFMEKFFSSITVG